jgi:hypothetical protein
MVAAHRIDRDRDTRPTRVVPLSEWVADLVDHRSGGGFVRRLLDLDRLAALVPAAVRADVVRQLLLVAVVALFEPRHAQGEVRAALAFSGVRDASLRNTHGSWSPSFGSV